MGGFVGERVPYFRRFDWTVRRLLAALGDPVRTSSHTMLSVAHFLAFAAIALVACDELAVPGSGRLAGALPSVQCQVQVVISPGEPVVPQVLVAGGWTLEMDDVGLRRVLALGEHGRLPLRGSLPLASSTEVWSHPSRWEHDGVAGVPLYAMEARFERVPFEPGVRVVGLALHGSFSVARARMVEAWGEGELSTRRGGVAIVWHNVERHVRAWLVRDPEGTPLVLFDRILPLAELVGSRRGRLGFETLPLLGAPVREVAGAYRSYQRGVHEVSKDLGVPTAMRLLPTEYGRDATVVALTVEEGVVVGVSVQIGVGVNDLEMVAIRDTLRRVYGAGEEVDARRVRYHRAPIVVLEESLHREFVTLHFGRVGTDAPGADGEGHRHFSADVVKACDTLVSRAWANANPAAMLLREAGREVSEERYRAAAGRFLTMCQVWPDARRACLTRAPAPMKAFEACEVNAGVDVLGRVKPLRVRDGLVPREPIALSAAAQGEMWRRLEGEWESSWSEAMVARTWEIHGEGQVRARRQRGGGEVVEERFEMGFPHRGSVMLTFPGRTQEQVFVVEEDVFWTAGLGPEVVHPFTVDAPMVVDTGDVLFVSAGGHCKSIVDNGEIASVECELEEGDDGAWWTARRGADDKRVRRDDQWRFLLVNDTLLDERLVRSGTFHRRDLMKRPQ